MDIYIYCIGHGKLCFNETETVASPTSIQDGSLSFRFSSDFTYNSRKGT